MSEPLRVVDCGVVPYEDARVLQQRVAASRQRGEVPDTLLLLEHPPVYTRGRRSDPAELPMGASWYEAQGIEVRDTDRGGRVTYHGPGQLVAYPVVELQPAASSAPRPGAAGSPSTPAPRPGAAGSRGYNVHAFVRALERVMIASLAEWRIEAGTIDGLTGVWVPRRRDTPGREAEDVSRSDAPRKIGSIGIHVSRGITTHGLAVNVNNDLQPFEWIVPCGIDDCRMTSVSRELGSEQNLEAFAATLADRLAHELDRAPQPLSPELLFDRVEIRPAAATALP